LPAASSACLPSPSLLHHAVRTKIKINISCLSGPENHIWTTVKVNLALLITCRLFLSVYYYSKIKVIQQYPPLLDFLFLPNLFTPAIFPCEPYRFNSLLFVAVLVTTAMLHVTNVKCSCKIRPPTHPPKKFHWSATFQNDCDCGVGLGRVVRKVRQHPDDHEFESQQRQWIYFPFWFAVDCKRW
jgi:hypothetical protein